MCILGKSQSTGNNTYTTQFSVEYLQHYVMKYQRLSAAEEVSDLESDLWQFFESELIFFQLLVRDDMIEGILIL